MLGFPESSSSIEEGGSLISTETINFFKKDPLSLTTQNNQKISQSGYQHGKKSFKINCVKYRDVQDHK